MGELCGRACRLRAETVAVGDGDGEDLLRLREAVDERQLHVLRPERSADGDGASEVEFGMSGGRRATPGGTEPHDDRGDGGHTDADPKIEGHQKWSTSNPPTTAPAGSARLEHSVHTPSTRARWRASGRGRR